MPSALAILPAREGHDNELHDAWRQDISYEVSASGVITLRSLGRDGVLGGVGDDADMIGRFQARDAQGKWSDGRVEWSEDPYYRGNKPQ